jgi:hypothetical protein
MTSDILEKFFDLDINCPEEIKNCAELRIEYKNKLNFLQKMNNCRDCDKTQLKQYFIDLIKYNIR